MEIEWIEAKTDWTSVDRFNISDYNRIRNNLLYLHDRGWRIFAVFDIEDMGNALQGYDGYWEVDKFNAFEKNVDIINENIRTSDYGERKTFYENGIFIDWQELNRIESAMLSMKNIIDAQSANIPNLAFRLGTYKSIKI